MFFNTSNITVDLVSILNLTWSPHILKSDIRNFHAISFRNIGNSQIIGSDNTIEMSTNEILFVPAFYQYTLNAEKEDVYVIHFYSKESLPKQAKKFKSENPEYFKRKFHEIYNIWSKKQIGYEHECKSIFYKILSRIEQESEYVKLNDNNDRIKQAIEYIHENFNNLNLSIENLAKISNVSETYFRKIFFENFFVSPKKYINDLRCKYALELLHSKYYTVNEVAEKCGFSNVYYFSSFIKKETGHSPSYYIK